MGWTTEIASYFYFIVPALIIVGILDIIVHTISGLNVYFSFLVWTVQLAVIVDWIFMIVLTGVFCGIIWLHYENPSRIRSLGDLAFLLLLGFLWTSFITPVVISLGTSMYLSVESPIIYSVFSSIYGLFYFVVFLIMDMMVNFINPEEHREEHQNPIKSM